ncbi:MAG: hypothetical protein QNJ46_08410 [Leptolyngbyaceae cyanobacterium MO_188.B28]|nr:hypothetical protein [Leptolyngbyaceae cyanobacterium MO_188.B28]
MVKLVIKFAKEMNCNKLITPSRTSSPKVHDLYQRLGFAKQGADFLIDF